MVRLPPSSSSSSSSSSIAPSMAQLCRVTSSRTGRCFPFGQSVFNAVVRDAKTPTATATATTKASTDNPFDNSKFFDGSQNDHYDRILIDIIQYVQQEQHQRGQGQNRNRSSNSSSCNNSENNTEKTMMLQIGLSSSSSSTSTSSSSTTPSIQRIVDRERITTTATTTTWKGIPFGRSKNCPTLLQQSQEQKGLASSSSSSSTSVIEQESIETVRSKTTAGNIKRRKPFVSLAVVGLVMDTTGEHLLLTKRPNYMRSFPNAYVFPGGGVEDNGETIQQAVSREVWEETNLFISPDQWTIESVWESVYPPNSTTTTTAATTIPSLSSTTAAPTPTPILAHHVVCFLSGRAPNCRVNRDGKEQQQQQLKLCNDEVDGAIWLSCDDVHWILQQHQSSSSSSTSVPTIINNNDTKASDASNDDERMVQLISTKSTPSTSQKYIPATSTLIPLHDVSGIYPQRSTNRTTTTMTSSTTKQNTPTTTTTTAPKTNNDDLCGIAQGSLFALQEFYPTFVSTKRTISNTTDFTATNTNRSRL